MRNINNSAASSTREKISHQFSHLSQLSFPSRSFQHSQSFPFSNFITHWNQKCFADSVLVTCYSSSVLCVSHPPVKRSQSINSFSSVVSVKKKSSERKQAENLFLVQKRPFEIKRIRRRTHGERKDKRFIFIFRPTRSSRYSQLASTCFACFVHTRVVVCPVTHPSRGCKNLRFFFYVLSPGYTWKHGTNVKWNNDFTVKSAKVASAKCFMSFYVSLLG